MPGARPEARVVPTALQVRQLVAMPADVSRVPETGGSVLLPATEQGGDEQDAGEILSGPPPFLRGYTPAMQLDEPPLPLEEWVLDEQALSQCVDCRLRVGVWVSAEGSVVHWRLLQASPVGPWSLAALAHLDKTPMRPGLIDGNPVAAHIVVEIAVSHDGTP